MSIIAPTARQLARVHAAGLHPTDVDMTDGVCTRCGAEAEPHEIVQGDRVTDLTYETDADGAVICGDCADDDRFTPDVDPNDPETRGLDPDALYDRAREDHL